MQPRNKQCCLIGQTITKYYLANNGRSITAAKGIYC